MSEIPAAGNDFEHTGTEELIAELQRRFDHSVFIGLSLPLRGMGKGGYSIPHVEFRGEMMTCLGMLETAKLSLGERLKLGCREPDGDNEPDYGSDR